MDAESEVDDTQTVTTEEVAKTDAVEETTAQVETEDKPEHTEFEIKQFERAKKAEAEAKKAKAELKALKDKPQASEKQDGGLTIKDIFALQNSKVHEEDVERVAKFAKDEGLSVSEALKNDELKAILDVRIEKRKSAEVSNTGGSKRSATKVSDEALLANAEKGIFPESEEDIARLWLAKHKKT